MEGVKVMDRKEIILSKIADILSKRNFMYESNSDMKARLKCIGLGELFDKYADYLIPHYFHDGYSVKFKNPNEEYDLFLGLDCIFSDLYKEGNIETIIELLKELVKSFNPAYIAEYYEVEFEELGNLYELLGLSLSLEEDKVKVAVCMQSDLERVQDLFSVESWLKTTHSEVYDAYKSAVDSYTQGNAGACIESCRTCLVSIFSKYKGTEGFAKWMKGIYNTSGDANISSVQDLSQALNTELKKEDLADFFYENKAGKLTKTKTVYMIYSMLSDYGTHRNESTQEIPSIEDALFALRLTDSILFWVYSKKK